MELDNQVSIQTKAMTVLSSNLKWIFQCNLETKIFVNLETFCIELDQFSWVLTSQRHFNWNLSKQVLHDLISNCRISSLLELLYQIILQSCVQFYDYLRCFQWIMFKQQNIFFKQTVSTIFVQLWIGIERHHSLSLWHLSWFPVWAQQCFHHSLLSLASHRKTFEFITATWFWNV